MNTPNREGEKISRLGQHMQVDNSTKTIMCGLYPGGQHICNSDTHNRAASSPDAGRDRLFRECIRIRNMLTTKEGAFNLSDVKVKEAKPKQAKKKKQQKD